MDPKLLLAWLFAFASLPAYGQQFQPTPKPPAAKFSLQLPVLRYTSSSIKSEAGSENVSEMSTQVLDDGFIGINLGKLAFYIYPFFDGNHFVSAGYMITDTIEIGADLGLNSGKNTENTLIGAWGYHYSTIGTWGWENGLSLSQTSKKSSAADATVKSEETSIKIATTLTYPLMRNLRYIGGAFIRNKSIDADDTGSTKILQFGFILAGLRMKWI